MNTNPFPGLRPFEAEENQYFFGRDVHSDEILTRLRKNHFVAVVGTSGSGKSSLIRAGVLPSLHGGFMVKAGSRWRIAVFRPGNDPVHNLAVALNTKAALRDNATDETAARSIETTLRRSALGLTEAVRQARMPAEENLLIVVDQFEELFRFKSGRETAASEDEAAAFVKLLVEATRQDEVPIYVVITIRSDFLGDCAHFRDLPELINEGLYLIPLMTRAQLREAVTGPVAVAEANISSALVTRVLNKIVENPERLPIMQHALMRTWNCWQEDHKDSEPLDLRHYEKVGGMAEALSKHADEAYDGLPDERAKEIAEKLFRCLTEKGVDNRQLRRPTTVREICAIAGATQEEVIDVIEKFREAGRSFLMPPSGVQLNAESLIDISHESLIGGWQRLKDWVERESVSAGIYRRLADTALLYPDRAPLLRDPELEVALAWRRTVNPNETWAKRYRPEYNRAMRFLDDSENARDAESIERERQHRKDRRLKLVFASIVLIAVTVSLASAYVVRQKQIASEQTQLAARRELDLQTLTNKQEREEIERQTRIAEQQRHEADQQKKINEEQRQLKETAQQQRIRAEEQKRIADQQKLIAERQAKWMKENVSVGRKQLLDDSQNIASLAEQLIKVSSPQERPGLRLIRQEALTKTGDHVEAIKEDSSALDVNPNDLGALLGRSNEYLVLGEVPGNAKKSVADVDRLLKSIDDMKVSPGERISRLESIAYLNKSISLAMLHEHDEAMKALNEAIKRFAFDGSVSFDSEVSDEIQSVTGQPIIVADGTTFRTALYYQRASLLALAGSTAKDFDEALKQADSEATKYARPIDAHLKALNWGWHTLRVQTQDDDNYAYGELAAQGALWERASVIQGNKTLAREYFRRFLAEHAKRRNPRYDNLAVWVRHEISQVDKAGRIFPDQRLNARQLVNDADESILRGDYTKAEGTLTEAIKLDPANVDLLIKRLRNRYHNLRNEDLAREDCEAVLRLAPRTPLANLYLGFLSANEKDEADYYRKVLEDDPINRSAIEGLSTILANNGQKEAALEYVRRSVKLNGDDVALLYKEAQLLREIKHSKEDLREALKSINIAIAIEPGDTKLYDERQTIELELGKNKTEAVRNRALGYRESGDLRYRLGQIDVAMRTYTGGLEILTKFLEKESANLGEADKSGLVGDITSLKFKLSTLTNVQTPGQGSMESLLKLFPRASFGDLTWNGVGFKFPGPAQIQ